MTGILIAAAVIAVPAFAFALWPLFRRTEGRVLISFPPDAREQLTEQKRSVLRALRELDFERSAGHVSDDDYSELRARYETEAAAILTELDRLGKRAAPPPAPPRPVATRRASAWQHPAALGAAAVFLLVFGVGLGVGIVRYSAPEPPAGAGGTMGGAVAAPMGPGADAPPMPGAAASSTGAPSGPLPPGTLQGMLNAAREALFSGRYSDALSAYQAILKREPNNADALAHVGLMAAMANHPDKALELIDRALKSDPTFAPALVYRGQVLESKGDVGGAISSWEKYLKVAPTGQDRERVQQMLAQARTRAGGASK